MTKQEYIESGVKAIVRRHLPDNMGFDLDKIASNVAKQILVYEESLGVVLKVSEIKEIRTTASEGEKYYAQGGNIAMMSTERTAHIFKALKEAGCGFFEPLIKEPDDKAKVKEQD